jgi:predicted esterase
MQALDLKNVPKPESEEALEKMRRSTPMFLYHGKSDDVLPFKAADKTYEVLRQEIYDGVKSETFKYTSENNLGHSLSPKEIREISQFMNFHMGKWGGQKDEL